MSPDTALVPQPTLDEFPEFVSIPVRVARNAAAWPDKQAVLCEDKARTWRDFDRRINRIARTLAGMGVGRGDKIAILAANSIEYLETFMGGLRAGACVVPLSTMAAADALEKMLDDCDAKVLFLSEQYRGLVEPYEALPEGVELLPGLRAYDASGHSDGVCVLTLNEGGEGDAAIFWADVVPTTHHIQPPYIMAYDLDVVKSFEVRSQWLEEAARGNWLGLFFHDEHVPFARIVKDGRRYRCEPAS